MALIFDFRRSHSTWVSFVAQDVVVQIFLVVDLADKLREALWCKGIVVFRFDRADADTLAQEELLAKGSWELSVAATDCSQVAMKTHQTSAAAKSTPSRTP